MCKRNLFCFCIFCFLLSSLSLLFLCGSATASAEKQLREDGTTDDGESEGHEKADINKELSEICAFFSGLHEWQSFVSGNVSELEKLSSSVVSYIEERNTSIKKMQTKIGAIKEKTERTKETVSQLSTEMKSDYCELNKELSKEKLNKLEALVLKNINMQKTVEENDVKQQLQAVNDMDEIIVIVKEHVEYINKFITNNNNPGHTEAWTTQKEKLQSFLTHTDQTKKAAQTVQQTAIELFKKLPELDKIIKAEQLKRKQEPPNDKTVEGKNGDKSKGNKDINESPQQPADAERTEKNDTNVTDASTVQTQTGKDDINQQALVGNTNKTNESSDTLNNQTPPNNTTKKEAPSPSRTEDGGVGGGVRVFSLLLAVLCVSAPLLRL